MDLDEAPKKPNALKQLTDEDLSTLSLHELEERVAILNEEIERVKKTMREKKAGLSLAESAFKT